MVGEGESVKVGAPLVAGAAVKCTVVSHGRHDKIKIFKMRRRKHYQKHQGDLGLSQEVIRHGTQKSWR